MRGVVSRNVLALTATLGAIACPVFVSSVRAAVLFSTNDDFSQWTAQNGDAAGGTTSFDYDGVTTNGLGNTTAASASGTGGALQITWAPSVGNFNFIASSPSEGSNADFLAAIDPGSTPAGSVAYSGIIQMVYTVPATVSGTYFELGINLQYAADGYYQNFFPDSGNSAGAGSLTTLGTVNGQTEMLATIPYTINAGQFNGFGFNVVYNSDYAPTDAFFVDSIQTVPAPEPASILGLSTAGLLLLRRRRD